MSKALFGRLIMGAALLAASVLAPAAAQAASPPPPPTTGNFIATGHDMDFHCAYGQPNECTYLKIVVDKVRNGSTLPILALDQGSELGGALTSAGYGSFSSVDPTTPAFTSTAFVDAAGHPLYSAIITASDSTCGGCDNTPAGETAINSRATDFATYFNAGGGILALSGADNYATYYNFVPLTVAGTVVAPPFTVTPDGAALGITNDMANCCPTHNSFSPPPSPFVTLETDVAGQAETIAAFNATIGGGGFTSDETVTATGVDVTATVGQPTTAPVATFTDTKTTTTATDYTATITWGDGTTSAGVITGATGSFSVSGTHTFTTTGSFPVTTLITPVANPSAAAIATSTATVSKAATTTTVTTSPTSAAFGDPVTFTAHVAPSAANTLTPTGTVSFYLNGSPTPLATVPLGSGGTASTTTSGLPAGPNTVTAVYNGDPNFTTSTSPATTVTVGGATTTITGRHFGAIIVQSGQTVVLSNATQYGAVVVQPGGRLEVESSTINGALSADKSAALRVCGSTIAGSVTVTNATGFVLIGDPAEGCAVNTIGGSLVVTNNHHGVQVIGNHVRGAVVASDNSGAGPFPADTTATVSGNGR